MSRAMQYTPKSSTTFVLVLLLFFLVSSILFLIFNSSLSLNHVVQSDFLDPMNELIGVALLRPMVVSVFNGPPRLRTNRSTMSVWSSCDPTTG